jgi:uncharacterized protein YqgV (UPF0045/DUF77 family)
MIATAEISLYPLHENYEEVIIEYILKLKEYNGLRVETNGMSTQVFGEYDTLMAAIAAESKTVFESGKAVLLIKLIGADRSKENLPEILK